MEILRLSLNTTGDLWKYDGTYTIKVNYGSASKDNSVKVELVGGIAQTPNQIPNNQCSINEIYCRVVNVCHLVFQEEW